VVKGTMGTDILAHFIDRAFLCHAPLSDERPRIQPISGVHAEMQIQFAALRSTSNTDIFNGPAIGTHWVPLKPKFLTKNTLTCRIY